MPSDLSGHRDPSGKLGKSSPRRIVRGRRWHRPARFDQASATEVLFTSLAVAALAVTCSSRQQHKSEESVTLWVSSGIPGPRALLQLLFEALLRENPSQVPIARDLPEREWCVYLRREGCPSGARVQGDEATSLTEMMNVLSANHTKKAYEVGGEADARALEQVRTRSTPRRPIDPEIADAPSMCGGGF
jgi:hypothetical protein